MEKINVAELLKDCPKGMELDCAIYENLYFDSLNADYYGTINCYTLIDGIKTSINFTKYGTFNNHLGAKCVIFPKGKTTWEGFVPPCQFKDGDILSYQYKGLKNRSIYIYRNHPTLNTAYYVTLGGDLSFMVSPKTVWALNGYNTTVRLATEEERQKLFDAIKANGYKWNAKTKTLEKLIKPKFKVGDRIRRKNSNEEYIIISINDDIYYYRLNEHCTGSLGIQLQDEYELVPNKFDINTLVAFDSRVLIRDTESQKWSPAIWGFYDSDHQDYQYKLVGCIARYCIPYEGNEHLLGKTDDCDEYFKTWK